MFPGGLHVQNWKINPKVKDLMQKNRSLVEELNLKSILVEELVQFFPESTSSPIFAHLFLARIFTHLP